jgi:hypothetical protein
MAYSGISEGQEMKPFPSLRSLADEVQTALATGVNIDKPDSRSRYTCNAERIRYVPPGKSFPYSQLYQMLRQIYASGQADRDWFERAMPEVNEQAPCDFTAMGHLLEHLGYATYGGYNSGVYRKCY